MPFETSGGGGGSVQDNYLWTLANFFLLSAYVDTNDDGVREFSLKNTLSAFLNLTQTVDIERVQRILNDFLNKAELKQDIELERLQRFLEYVATNGKILLESIRTNLEDDNHADVLGVFVLGLINQMFPMFAPPLNFLFQIAQFNDDVMVNEILDVGALVRGFFNDPIGLVLGMVFEVISAFLIDELIIGLTPKDKSTPSRQNYILMAALKFQNEFHSSGSTIDVAPYAAFSFSRRLNRFPTPHRVEASNLHQVETPELGFFETHQ